jgi:hypothetical protein
VKDGHEEKEPTMKYMLIIYGNQELWESFPADVRERTISAVDAFNRKHFDSGELLGAYGVADAVQARVVRVQDGMPAVTDGPYLESKEYLASWYLIDVPDEKRALEIAAELAAVTRDIEVWPILHEGASDL